MEDHEDKMSNHALHLRIKKLENIICHAGFYGVLIRQLARWAGVM